MSTVATQITSLTIVYSTVWSDADQRKHRSSALLAFVRGIHRLLVNSPHKWPVTRIMFSLDDVIMISINKCSWKYDVHNYSYTSHRPTGLVSTWWRHQMEPFSALLAICARNSPVNYPHKGQWRGALMFSLICAWLNGCVSNREAGDLRRFRAHYDVIVMNDMHWCMIVIKQ